jgi:hypothetical protein
LFTKIFCPTDAHTSPASTYATMVPRSATRIEIKPKIVVDSIEAVAVGEPVIFEDHQNSQLLSSVKSNSVVKPKVNVNDF